MWKGLRDELDHAKKKRNISTKEIIYECGCSTPHFNKVISGERKPGKELIKKLSLSLRLSESYINEALKNNPIDKQKKISKKNIAIYIIITFLAFFSFKYFFIDKKNNKIPIKPIKKEAKISGDNSIFIKDVTIPDGMYISTNTSFKKIWRIKNTGSVIWENRYLIRVTPFSELICHSEKMVPIKKTLPNEEVDISVNFKSMSLAGSCRTDWKMVDKYHSPFFLNKHGLYSIVNITNDTSLTDKNNRKE